ncbi:putative hydrolase of the HAD superfamily [Franzmannia pantelleriensis]|uniref:Putative hydrolase of the HAD superfamily n=1 Tax=Franzmannia pantelleriensis TaxID=48727 RepID=A0A1G9T9R7_9GAMM|nr:HAD family hydrolase [Halomonas pantelleriensis]SDM44391.1 putative hydrolase of the HAD superfamily [Halomonas pantelleriensis]
MPTIDALTFDLDDTLWDNRSVMQRTESGHYAWLDEALAAWLTQRSETPRAGFTQRFPLESFVARRQQLARAHPLRRGDFTWIRQRALTELLMEYGLGQEDAGHWAARAMERFMALRHQVEPYAEVDALLTALSQRYRLASITNGNVDIARLPLGHHFPVAILAGEMLAPKPDARPFLAALARLGSRPSRALHVGDSWREDVLPAQRLGMRVAWIDARDEGATRLPPGVHRLGHVSELPALLARLD